MDDSLSAQMSAGSSKCRAAEVFLGPKHPWEKYNLNQVSPMLCTIHWCIQDQLQKRVVVFIHCIPSALLIQLRNHELSIDME